MLRWSIWLHKWIALVVAVQVVGWVLGGLVMTAIPIERVRSEHHMAYPKAPRLDLGRVLPAAEVAARAGLDDLTAVALRTTPRGPIWELTSEFGGEGWYDAVTGENVNEITQADARRAAVADYVGKGRPVRIVHYDEAPAEAQTSGAVWMVGFDDAEKTRLYLSAYTGEVESRRSDVWRLYNLFYQIHIMNFSGSQNYNHPLIVVATALTLTMTAAGVVLLCLRLSRDLRNARTRRKRG